MTSDNGTAAGNRICPACGATLVKMDRDGILIDRCPNCRGIWLDRGELEKLIAAEHEDGPHYERPVEEVGEEPEPAEKLASRRSFFGELFDLE